MTLPKLEWMHVNQGLPARSGLVTVYAIVNIGTPHQSYAVTQLLRDPEIKAGWRDMGGDAIDDRCIQVIYWLLILLPKKEA